MDKKEPIKVSLGTTICIFIIFILIVALIGMYFYYNYIANKSNISYPVQGENKIENVETNSNIATKNELENSVVNENSNATSSQGVDNYNHIIQLVKESEEKTAKKSIIHEIRVRKLSKESDNRYLITADYNIPVEITENEYKELVKTGDCGKYLGFSGTYNKTSKTFSDGEGYGFVVLESQDFEGTVEYEIVKTDTGYSFIYPAGPGYPISTSTRVEFYLGENDIIYVEGTGEKALKEYAKTLEEKLSKESTPIVTVKCENEKIYLFESSK